MGAEGGVGEMEGLVRSVIVYVSPRSELLMVADGKWTMYRAMVKEAVDVVVKMSDVVGRVKGGCVTDRLRLVGSEGWTGNMFIPLIQQVGVWGVGRALLAADFLFVIWVENGCGHTFI